jgi:hypothetical protein
MGLEGIVAKRRDSLNVNRWLLRLPRTIDVHRNVKGRWTSILTSYRAPILRLRSGSRARRKLAAAYYQELGAKPHNLHPE